MLAPVLPIVNPILGREREIEQVLSLLDGDGVRVLSLLGPGGVGKTRLALEVLRLASDDFAHGACFVPLAPVRDHALVPAAVAQALGLRESGALPVAELLVDWLREKHFLLVLDNLEQVIAAASPWLTDLLVHCPRLKVVATSRIPLDIAGEQRFRVPTLPVPESIAPASLDEYASVALFSQRAQGVRSDFLLDSDNSKTVAEICARLDGLPLAIELAAARINVFSPAEILARLTDKLSLLTSHRRDAPLRLRSMRDAIGWSYDLLSIEERELFCGLTVFVGGFSLDAAEYVAAQLPSTIDRRDVVETVAGLVDQSLVERVDDAAETRFRMLETIREFGIAHLADRGELESVHNVHAEYFKHLADRAESGLRGPDQATWLRRLELEHGNLREAIAWLTCSDRVPEAVELFSNIVHFMLVHAHFTEWRQLLDGWFARPELEQRTRTRALALFADGFSKANLGDPASEIHPLEEALDLFRELGDTKRTVHALNICSYFYCMAGDTRRARVANDECLPLARQIGDTRAEGLALDNLARIAWGEGDLKGAQCALEESLAVARKASDDWLIGMALGSLSELVLLLDDDPVGAKGLIDEARFIQEGLGDKRNLPVAHIQLAAMARVAGDVDAAHAHLQTSLSIALDTGQPLFEAIAHLDLGKVALLHHDLDQSARELRQAISLLLPMQYLPDIADALDALAELAFASGDARAAARLLGASKSLIGESMMPWDVRWPTGEHDRIAAMVRAALGGEKFERAHADAQGWSVDEAVSAALAFELPATHSEPPKATGNTHGLSPRELDVLRLMANGLSNQNIADELYLSRRTVTSHVTGILGKLGLASRTQAVAFAIRGGIA